VGKGASRSQKKKKRRQTKDSYLGVLNKDQMATRRVIVNALRTIFMEAWKNYKSWP